MADPWHGTLKIPRQPVYEAMWGLCDANNELSVTQGELAKRLGISYQRMSMIIQEFIALGMMERNGKRFVVLYDPKKVPWDRYEELRRKYSDQLARSKGWY